MKEFTKAKIIHEEDREATKLNSEEAKQCFVESSPFEIEERRR